MPVHPAAVVGRTSESASVEAPAPAAGTTFETASVEAPEPAAGTMSESASVEAPAPAAGATAESTSIEPPQPAAGSPAPTGRASIHEPDTASIDAPQPAAGSPAPTGPASIDEDGVAESASIDAPQPADRSLVPTGRASIDEHRATVLRRRDEAERLGNGIAELAARIQAATYELLVMIRAFDEREGWSGFKSCAHWLNWRTGLALGAAREKVRVARALGDLPLLSDAMRHGRISYSKVRALTRVATPANERRLLHFAECAPASYVERLARAWCRVDRVEEAADERRRHERRQLTTWVDDDGMVVIRGRLSPEVGAVVGRALEAAGDRLWKEAPREEAAETSYGQRQADALGLVAESALAADLDRGTAGDRYQVVLHVEAETLRAGTGGPAPDARALAPTAAAMDVSAETPASAAVDVPAETSGGAAADASAETPSAAVPGVSAETPTAAAAHVSAETPSSAAAHVFAETPTAAAARVSAETPSSAVPDVSAETPRIDRSGAAAETQRGRSPASMAAGPVGTTTAGEHGANIAPAPATATPETTGHAALEDADGLRVSAETARRVACDAGAVVMRHAADGAVLDVGRKTRTIPPALRRALQARDRQCRFPGCNARRCDAHHVRHWADGGATRLDNLVLLCRRHHRAVHEEGFAVRMGATGEAEFHWPDGRPLPAVPPAPQWTGPPLAPTDARLDASGIAIGPDTATPDWHGERLDLVYAIDVLWTPRDAGGGVGTEARA